MVFMIHSGGVKCFVFITQANWKAFWKSIFSGGALYAIHSLSY